MIPTNENEVDKYPIRTAFQRFYPAYLEAHPDLPSYKRKVANCISKCKTGELGYNVSVCEKCGKPQIHASSCNNRSCPCCQSALAKKWEMERNTELIEGISYFHVVFTVPHELNPLIFANMTELLSLIFRCVNRTLLALCASKKFLGAKPGIMSVLHTWGQTLSFHPHIHTCISGGGITRDGEFKEAKHKNFFIPVKVIASSFRGRCLDALKELYKEGNLKLKGNDLDLEDPAKWKQFIDSLYKKEWLPFIKETFNGNGNAIRYLARYSYRSVISNNRILSVDDKNVTFVYKDYADGNKEKVMTLEGTQFIGRFLQHILPPSFHRTRCAGYLSNSTKTKNLKLIHKSRNTTYHGNPYRHMNTAELLMVVYGIDILACPHCSGRLIILARGAPKDDVTSLLKNLPKAMS